MKLTNEQWERVKEVMPERKKPWLMRKRGGRPPVDDSKCFEGILWILWTGVQWATLPKEYGAKSAVHRRLSKWVDDGLLEKMWHVFLGQLLEKEQIRWNDCFIDGTFASAKKGATKSERPNAARERSLWYWLMAGVLRSEFTWTRHPRRLKPSMWPEASLSN